MRARGAEAAEGGARPGLTLAAAPAQDGDDAGLADKTRLDEETKVSLSMASSTKTDVLHARATLSSILSDANASLPRSESTCCAVATKFWNVRNLERTPPSPEVTRGWQLTAR